MLKISLRAARINAGMTQKEVADKLRKHKMTIAHWENGQTPVDMANFAAMCNLYGVPENCVIMPKKLANG